MILKKIQLQNIRSHKDTSVDLNTGITIFTGKTGCGKSSILMAIAYVLFGSNSVSNRALLKRGTDKGKIVLEFEESGKMYIVSRGLKRKKDTVSSDPDQISIYVDGEKQEIVGRETDVNEYIRKVLNYPENAKNLFEVTSYTKQDEIRKLIEMRSSERQEYIDEILDISKYLNTFKNLKPILDYLKSRIESFSLVEEEMENLKKEVMDIESKIIQKEGGRDVSKTDLDTLKERRTKLDVVYKEIKSKYTQLKSSRDLFIQTRSKVENLESNFKNENEILNENKTGLNQLKEELSHMGERKESKSVSDAISLINGKISSIQTEEKRIKNELTKFRSVGSGKCPICLQEVTSQHIEKVGAEYDKRMKEIKDEVEVLNKELLVLKKEREKSEKYEDLKSKIENKKEHVNTLKNKISDIEKNITQFKDKLNQITFSEEEYKSLESDIERINKELMDTSSQLSSKEKEYQMLGEEIKSLQEDIENTKKRYSDLEKSQKNIKKLNQLYETLLRMREDIRSIRDVVRKKFLNDFRQTFLNNFEDIRTEEEYVVDIKEDYEPVAFGNEVEVLVDHLSGGERTSVAIAYRLALAKIAAEMSSVRQSELIILDEPTTGLDKEDIKMLPEILKKIKTIPQIIIVTHEDILKEAADFKQEVNKVNGTSEVLPN